MNLYHLNKILGIIFLLSLLLLQTFSLKLTETIHWTTHRSRVAQFYYQDLSTKLSTVSHPTQINFIGSITQQKELSVALVDHYALMVWFPNKIIKVRYDNKADFINPDLINEEILLY